ncbi:hypothetical protein MNBD_CHLOROFLEXI01-2848 [hydrothermal vent metagenome]|uniref:Uncharacterized protein n=1 Tax=hydrothermal vent metagenome TaxID=652676 RepID=A0A3B0VSN1_9ZZZZ
MKIKQLLFPFLMVVMLLGFSSSTTQSLDNRDWIVVYINKVTILDAPWEADRQIEFYVSQVAFHETGEISEFTYSSETPIAAVEGSTIPLGQSGISIAEPTYLDSVEIAFVAMDSDEVPEIVGISIEELGGVVGSLIGKGLGTLTGIPGANVGLSFVGGVAGGQGVEALQKPEVLGMASIRLERSENWSADGLERTILSDNDAIEFSYEVRLAPKPLIPSEIEQEDSFTLRIINETDQTICRVYIAPEESSWGENQIPYGSRIANDSEFPFSFSGTGEYTLLLQDCDGREIRQIRTNMTGNMKWAVSPASSYSIRVYNASAENICSIQIWPITTEVRGRNLLGPSYIDYSNNYTTSLFESGVYNIRAEDCYGNLMQEEVAVLLLGEAVVNITRPERSDVYLRVKNEAFFKSVCEVYIWPSGTSNKGANRLYSVLLIPPKSNRIINNIAPGRYAFRAIDCKGNIIESMSNVEMDGPKRWDVNTN